VTDSPIDLPLGWRYATVGAVSQDIQSGFASGRHNALGVGVLHVRPMNVSRDGRLTFDEAKFVVDETDRRLRLGDVVFNNTNSPALVGKTALVTSDRELAYSNHMTRVRVRPDAVDPAFLAAQLHSMWMNGYFERICSNHVNQASVSARRLAEVEVVVPPLDEQVAAIGLLEAHVSRLDAALTSLDRIIGASPAIDRAASLAVQLRRSLMQAAFTGRLTDNWRMAHHG
jgi:type I restriction enzyme S subunit